MSRIEAQDAVMPDLANPKAYSFLTFALNTFILRRNIDSIRLSRLRVYDVKIAAIPT